nr:MAG TPA: hypothetical protein [Crassvirales sp.]
MISTSVSAYSLFHRTNLVVIRLVSWISLIL